MKMAKKSAHRWVMTIKIIVVQQQQQQLTDQQNQELKIHHIDQMTPSMIQSLRFQTLADVLMSALDLTALVGWLTLNVQGVLGAKIYSLRPSGNIIVEVAVRFSVKNAAIFEC
jgi:hypothetical protein